jgi:hypothetical protein
MLSLRCIVAAAPTIAGLAVVSGALAQNCQPQWDLSIGTPGAASGYIQPMIVWNDGTGEKLYVGGSFTNLASHNYIAAYDLASGTWSGLGGGVSASFIAAFAVFNPGSGERLIVGGANWEFAGGVPGTRHLAMWDGQNWQAMGTDFIWSDSVWALHVWDDGTGAKLYAGGGFQQVGGTPMHRVARWDGTTWSPLGGGVTTANSTVFALTNFNDGTGDALYAGGNFSQVEGNFISRIARWDGAAWSSVGGGITFLSAAQGVAAMRVLDVGNGPALYVSGTQFSAGGQPFANAARWDGQTWTALGQGMAGSVQQMTVLDEGNGPTLYAGSAGATGGGTMGYFLRLNEATNMWESAGVAFNNTIFGVYRHQDRLFLAGSFTTFDGAQPGGIQDVGRIIERSICPAGEPCYANCDGSTVAPILNVEDFTCFINKFSEGVMLPHEQQLTHYANCDQSTAAPVLNVEDFTCFINKFAAGCR